MIFWYFQVILLALRSTLTSYILCLFSVDIWAIYLQLTKTRPWASALPCRPTRKHAGGSYHWHGLCRWIPCPRPRCEGMDVFRYGNDGKDISVDLFYESENDYIDGLELEVGYGDVMVWCCLPLLWYLAHSTDVFQTLVMVKRVSSVKER